MVSIVKVDQIQNADGTVEYLNTGTIKNATLDSTVTGGSGITALGTVASGTFNGTVGSSADLTNADLTNADFTNVRINVNASKGISATTVISDTRKWDRINITADYLTLTDSQNMSILTSSVSLTPIITDSGVNGLDTGSVAASNWYYYWAISNGTTTAGLWSLSYSSPTMPSGYTYKKFIGAVYNQSSGGSGNAHLCEVHQKGGWIYTYYGSNTASNKIYNKSSMSTNTQHEVNPTTFIPPNADFYEFRFQGDTANTAYIHILFNSGVFKGQSGTAASDGIGVQQIYWYGASSGSAQAGGSMILPMITPQKFYCNPIYAVGTTNLYHVGYQYLGII